MYKPASFLNDLQTKCLLKFVILLHPAYRIVKTLQTSGLQAHQNSEYELRIYIHY